MTTSITVSDAEGGRTTRPIQANYKPRKPSFDTLLTPSGRPFHLPTFHSRSLTFPRLRPTSRNRLGRNAWI